MNIRVFNYTAAMIFAFLCGVGYHAIAYRPPPAEVGKLTCGREDHVGEVENQVRLGTKFGEDPTR